MSKLVIRTPYPPPSQVLEQAERTAEALFHLIQLHTDQMNEEREWRAAVLDLQADKPQRLAALLRTKDVVPERARHALADFLLGKLKVRKRKLSLRDEAEIAAAYCASHSLWKLVREQKDKIADLGKCEPSKIIETVKELKRAWYADTAAKYNVSKGTIENVLEKHGITFR